MHRFRTKYYQLLLPQKRSTVLLTVYDPLRNFYSTIMADTFQQYFTDIDEKLMDLEQEVKRIREYRGAMPEDRVTAFNQHLEDVSGDILIAENEYDCIRDVQLQKELTPFLEEMKNRYTKLQTDIVEALEKQKQNNKQQTMTILQTETLDNGETLENDENQLSNPKQRILTTMQKLGIAKIFYEGALDNLDQAEQNMDENIEINQQISEQMQKDTDKMHRIISEEDALKAENRLARRELRRLAMRVSSNKCYLVLFFAIVLIFLSLTIADMVKTLKK